MKSKGKKRKGRGRPRKHDEGPAPGYGQGDRADYVSPDGRTELFFRAKGAPPPVDADGREDWDVCVPNRNDPNGVVYIRYIGAFVVLVPILAYVISRLV